MSTREEVAEAIKEAGVLGCGCCATHKYAEGDPCPEDEDGYKDHTYWGECAFETPRELVIADIALTVLGERR